jgi:glycosyltransferase involved in cell wall biosynthesis
MQKICIVIPCYNEEHRFNTNEISGYVGLSKLDISFCFVNDGSADNTLKILETFCSTNPSRYTLINLHTNSGKAEAVRVAMLKMVEANKYTHIGFWDADFSTPISETEIFVNYFSLNVNVKYVMGSRFKRLGSNINRKKSRHILGRVFSTFASMILNLPVYDTQCGAKLFSADIVQSCFAEKFKTKWLFDVEILARLRNNHSKEFVLNSVVEHPLNQWNEIGGSKLKLKHILTVPFQLIAINNKYN